MIVELVGGGGGGERQNRFWMGRMPTWWCNQHVRRTQPHFFARSGMLLNCKLGEVFSLSCVHSVIQISQFYNSLNIALPNLLSCENIALNSSTCGLGGVGGGRFNAPMLNLAVALPLHTCIWPRTCLIKTFTNKMILMRHGGDVNDTYVQCTSWEVENPWIKR